MAAVGADSDEEFNDILEELIRERELGLGADNQSDVELSEFSSVHTSDLSDEERFRVTSSESDEMADSKEWSDTVEDHEIEDFTSFVGPNTPLALDAKPVEYFLQLFPPHLLRKIAEQTNFYAKQKGAVNFEKTTPEEIRVYMGVLFLMGVIQLPNYRWECQNCGVALCKDRGCFGQFHNYQQ
ncbi:hypothetical protein BaRGS_00004463 [Batillaria attramentaria]|uniref:PiggyBac transposable element-derived protein domain-containing protein n=1 Tax=Batillaria attramentaria TaxID=370345 RepID=A0ABD0LYR7_9CAEN